MKYKINKNGVIKGIVTSFLAILLCGMLFLNILIPSLAADSVDNSSNRLYFNVNDVLNDPIKIQTSKGYYFSPESYVYFGSVYNTSTEQYEPILCRVLDANADNNGESGAIFVLTEDALSLNQRFSNLEDIFVEYYETENIYTESVMGKWGQQENYFTSTELALIRSITKTDVAAEMQGMFGYIEGYGYAWETNTADDLSSESAVLLNQSKIFPLSAKELHDYVASYNGAPVLPARHLTSNTSVSWWLRTGFDDAYGNLVGAVDESGKIIMKEATATDVAGRFAFNIEKQNISYVEDFGNNVYRLAYKSNITSDFTASIANIKNNELEIKFENAPTDIITNNRKDNYISIIIKDSDGNVKYYETADEPVRNSYGTRCFTLPNNYSDDDTLCVFWEEKGDNYWDISFTGDMVELDCVHSPSQSISCQSPEICAKCGEAYGYKNSEIHKTVSTELYFDSENDIHWSVCHDCGERINVTNCTFGNSCIGNCICGNEDLARTKHTFDENGICINNKNHYEPPVRIGRGAVSDFEIQNEGQFLFLAEYLNSGKPYNIYGEYWGVAYNITLEADLNFSGVDFIAMGTEENPYSGLIFDGKGHTISGINYNTENNYAGIFGVADGIYIENLTIKNSRFSGKIASGAIVGKASDVVIKTVLTIDSTVNSTDANGYSGAFVGFAENVSITSASISYEVTNDLNSLLAFAGNGGATISESFCLAENTNTEKGEMTLEQFENGEVGYAYASYWRRLGKKAGQELGVDPYPILNGAEIFEAITCDGRKVYFNDESNREQIEAHSFNAFAKNPIEFIWQQTEGYRYSCHVHAICEICGKEGLAEAYVYENVYSSSSAQTVPRIDFTATITLGGVTATDTYIIISNNIQEYFGVTNVVKDFDGQYVDPYSLLENTRLDNGEYIAFFINSETGEKYFEISYDWYGQPYEAPRSVLGVGKYDLLLIGDGAFVGQEYLYKNILEINQVTVTVTPKDVYKFYDGTSSLTSEFTTDASELLGEEWLVVKYDNLNANTVGVYTVNVIAEVARNSEYYYEYDEYARGIKIVLSKNTVSAFILPANNVTIENKSYPTSFTYGDTIPVPTKDYFNVNFDTPLSFEWYSAKYDYYEESATELKRISGQPQNAGTYILRVVSAPTDSTLGASYDLLVEIEKKQISLSVILPDGVEYRDVDGEKYYFIDSLDQIKYEVNGLVNGDTIDSANIIIESDLNGLSPFEDCPNRKNYTVRYYIYCYNELGISGNYEGEIQGVLVSLSPNSIPTPQSNNYVYDNEKINYEILVNWNAPGVAEEYGEYYEYTVEVYNSNNERVFIENKGSLYYFTSTDSMIRLYESGEYTVIIKCALRNNFLGTTVDEYELEAYTFTVEITDENGQSQSSIDGLGKYLITVTCDGEQAKAEIVAQRRITMLVKETFINLNDASISFNKENIVMRAGEVLLLGHTLADVEFDIDVERGEITVSKIVVLDENGNDVSYLYSLNTYDSSREYNILHIYDAPCDSECNYEYCDKTRAVSHSGGRATCTELATCGICGMLYGEYDSNTHVSENTTFVVNPDNHETHLELANCCGAVINVHNHSPKSLPTCTELALCEYCDWRYGELDPNNHSSSEVEYLQNASNAYEHLKKHLCCGSIENESHSGGKVTCTSQAICEKCQAHYGELDKDNHENEPSCSINPDNHSEHKIAYSCCNVAWVEDHSGGKATCTSQAICALCNEKYGEFDLISHASDKLEYLVKEDNVSMHEIYHACCHDYIGKAYHSGGKANCASPALCEHCGSDYGKIDSSIHQSDEIVYIEDGNMHIKAHACCSKEIAREEHLQAAPTCMNGTLCELCGHEEGERAEHVYDNDCDYTCNTCNEVTRSAGFHIDENNDSLCDNCEAEMEDKELSGGVISGIAVGSVAAAGVGGFSLFWFVIKKKSLAALLKLLFA